MACKHFQQEIHNFNKHANFIIIYHLTNASKSKETHNQWIIKRENHLILKLDTLHPTGFKINFSNT